MKQLTTMQSIKQTNYSTIITTKSGIVRTYTFNTIKQNNEFYNSQL